MFPSLALVLNYLLQTFFDILRYPRKNDHLPTYSLPFIERLSRPHLIFLSVIGYK